MTISYSSIGKTLSEIQKDCGYNPNGYAVFLLFDENDNRGKLIAEDFSIGDILHEFPEYAELKVKLENDFYGETVFRVLKEK